MRTPGTSPAALALALERQIAQLTRVPSEKIVPVWGNFNPTVTVRSDLFAWAKPGLTPSKDAHVYIEMRDMGSANEPRFDETYCDPDTGHAYPTVTQYTVFIVDGAYSRFSHNDNLPMALASAGIRVGVVK